MHKQFGWIINLYTLPIIYITIGKWPPLLARTPHILSYNRGNLLRGQISCTHDDCGYLRVIFCAHRFMYRPFVCKIILPQPQFAHIYLLHLFLCRVKYTAKAQQPAIKKGRARQGSLPPFRQKFPATALPLFLPHFTSIYH